MELTFQIKQEFSVFAINQSVQQLINYDKQLELDNLFDLLYVAAESL